MNRVIDRNFQRGSGGSVVSGRQGVRGRDGRAVGIRPEPRGPDRARIVSRIPTTVRGVRRGVGTLGVTDGSRTVMTARPTTGVRRVTESRNMVVG